MMPVDGINTRLDSPAIEFDRHRSLMPQTMVNHVLPRTLALVNSVLMLSADTPLPAADIARAAGVAYLRVCQESEPAGKQQCDEIQTRDQDEQ